MMRRPTCFNALICVVAVATCILFVGPSGARAELFLYEGFDYPADFLLDSEGGFGFDELIDEDTFEGEDEVFMWVNPLLDTVPSDNDAVFLPFRKRPELEERGTWQFDYMRLTAPPADSALDALGMLFHAPRLGPR